MTDKTATKIKPGQTFYYIWNSEVTGYQIIAQVYNPTNHQTIQLINTGNFYTRKVDAFYHLKTIKSFA